MDKYGWIEKKIYNLCRDSPINNGIFSFGKHDSHFDDRALIHTEHQKFQPFILKLGDSGNDHPNDIEPNAKLKSIYNEAKSAWMMRYLTTQMIPHHINSIFVEAWGAFYGISLKNYKGQLGEN